MSLRNTADNYGSIAKWLHWATALLVLGSYTSVYYRHLFTAPKTSANWDALQLHLSFGVTIGVLVFLRILWRLSNRAPDPVPGSPLMQRAAHYGHLALYAVLIIMPVTGYFGTGVDTHWFFLFDVPNFKDSAFFAHYIAPHMSFKEFEKPLDFLHKDVFGPIVVWMLIAGHVAAAMYHHVVLKDRTLKRMTTGD